MTLRRALAVIFAAVLFALAASSTLRAQEPPWKAKVDAVFAEREKPGMPGCALGVFRNGSIEYARGYGLANLEHNIPVTTKTIFDLGSVSKQFTATSIILLAQQGKLSLDDDVRKFVPELRDFGARITIRHLLNHTSGLRDYLTLFSLSGVDFDGVTGDDEALRIIARQRELNFPPGAEYLYSNSGYFLLSVIVKRASGKSLREFAQENLFGPLGMKNTHFHDNHTEIVPLRATAYAPRREGGFRIDMSGFEQTGDGAVFTSVEDFLLWEQNFGSKKIGGENLFQELHARGKLTSGETIDYAAGLVHAKYKGLELVEHGGSWAGYRSSFVRVPAEKLAVACLCNFANAGPDQLARRVLDVVLADKLVAADAKNPEPPVITLPEAALKPWAGIYRNAANGNIRRVQFTDGKLRVDSFTPQSFELQPLSESRFRVGGVPVRIVLAFAAARGAQPAQMTIEREGAKPETLAAVQPFAVAESELPAFAGDYFSDELDIVWHIALKDGKLTNRIGASTTTTELRPAFRDAFIASGVQLIFEREAAGRPQSFTIQAGRVRNIRFVRR
ncbi:MAG TPA: serine hydrolase domain-containing protein [Candidatus Nitrosotenuis sp.]|nr:serine hydrolase domain-containing protein [Candidatus Nitrosotenuis sp.]